MEKYRSLFTMSPITDKKTLQQLLAAQQHQPQRSAGQNFLICPGPVTATTAALLDNLAQVVELGAGAGALTEALLAAGHQVTAIERDPVLSVLLQKRLLPSYNKQLTVVSDDMRRHSWERPTPYALVGNIPYNLSGYILRRLPGLTPQPEQVVLLVQREVGQRLMAEPPQMSLLSVAVQLWGTPQRLMPVPARCFWPKPKIDSLLVSLTPHRQQLPAADYQATVDVARLAFRTKRKQLGGSLRRALTLPEQRITEQLAAAGLSPSQRPEEVSVKQWTTLAKTLTK